MNNGMIEKNISIDFEPLDIDDTRKSKPPSSDGKAPARAIPFSIGARGYDPSQVDLYLRKLTGEYSNLYRNYSDLSAKYNELAERPDANADLEAIAKALVDAESSALKIVAKAKEEAAVILEGAQQDLALIHNERTRLKMDIGDIFSRLKALGISA